MTQTPEMPNSVFLSPGLGGIVGFEQFPTSTEYIRRAVSKEEAERILYDLKITGWDMPGRFLAAHAETIRKLLEAHK